MAIVPQRQPLIGGASRARSSPLHGRTCADGALEQWTGVGLDTPRQAVWPFAPVLASSYAVQRGFA